MQDSLRIDGVPPAYAEFTRGPSECVVRLVLEGLDATSKFWQDDGYPLGIGPYGSGIGLATFIRDLAENWRGWQGVKSWSDFERTLSIQAEHDGLGHVTLSFEMRSSAFDGWRASGPLPVEAGALDRLAAATERFDTAFAS